MEIKFGNFNSMLRILKTNRLYNRPISCNIYFCRSFSIRKSDEREYEQVKAIHVEKTPITTKVWNFRRPGGDYIFSGRSADSEILDNNFSIIDRKPDESRFSVNYHFSEDSTLRDSYVDAIGSVRTGKLLEDLDALAGTIAYAHCDDKNDNTRPLSLVTASVDNISLKRNLIAIQDLILTGQIVWVGKSSMDILMEIHSSEAVRKYNPQLVPILISEAGNSSRLLSSYFTFVARNPITNTSVAINKLTGLNEDEIKLFKIREQEQLRRKNSIKGREQIHPDKQTLRALVERGMVLEDMPALAHSNSVLMRHTALENSLICQPQNVNPAGRVFGGFLMHRAFDLAQATCYTFAGSLPEFREVDKVTFERPVDVGDLVRMKSRVVATFTDNTVDPTSIVEVTCQVVRPERASSFISNTFYFTFGFGASSGRPTLRRVLPSTLEEANTMLLAISVANSQEA